MAWRNSRVFASAQTVVPAFDGAGEAIEIVVNDPDSEVDGVPMRGISTIGGVFYDGDKFPAEYRGNLFFAETSTPGGASGYIQAAVFDENHDLVSFSPFQFTGIYPTGLAVDPDGYGPESNL